MKNRSRINKNLVIALVVMILIIISLFAYEILTIHNTYYINEKNLQIPILVYHDIVEDDSKIEYDYMQTSINTFEKQIVGLMNLGYKPISYQDLVDYKAGKKAIPKWSFLITFDDGYAGVYNYAHNIAKKYNIPMTVFAINDCVGLTEYCTWEQLKELHDNKLIAVYSHGYTHIEYDKQLPEQLLIDINNSYQQLEEKLEDAEILKVFTYPYGLNTYEERKLLYENGYVQNLTDNRINNSKNLDLSGLHRCYPLSDSILKIIIKIQYRMLRYGG